MRLVRLSALMITVGAACAPVAGDVRPVATYLQVNVAGGRADGAERNGIDDVAAAVADAALDAGVDAVFLNEACESHAAHVANRLGERWRAFFVQAWDGPSHCFPAPGSGLGRFGNAVLVRDVAGDATALTIPSCNDAGVDPARCVPNWAPPAEQRRIACASIDRTLLCAAHLDPRHWAPHDDQLRALGGIAVALAGEHDVVVVGGDLNDTTGAVVDAFGPTFVDLAGDAPKPTYPSTRPGRTLDHVLAAGEGVRAGGVRTVDLGRCAHTHFDDHLCSDHLAVIADLAAG